MRKNLQKDKIVMKHLLYGLLVGPLLLMGLVSCEKFPIGFFKKSNIHLENVTAQEDKKIITIVPQIDSLRKEDTVITWHTKDGSATSLDDYVANKGTLTIPAGKLQPIDDVIEITLKDDTLNERTENFQVVIEPAAKNSNSDRSTLEKTIQVIIQDTDPLPTITLNYVEVNESREKALVSYELSTPSGRKTSFQWTTLDIEASAKKGDYTFVSTIEHIPKGAIRGAINIPITDDNIYEAVERFKVMIQSLDGLLSQEPHANVTIISDDPVPTLILKNAQANEGAGTISIPFTLSNPTSVSVSFQYSTLDGSAIKGEDYERKSSARVNLAEEMPRGTFSIPLINDTKTEDSEENFNIAINPSSLVGLKEQGNTLNSQATIIDDDRHLMTERFIFSESSLLRADILWVIDNSGSMEDEQKSLASAFQVFIADFILQNIDYNMAIVTTDSARDRISSTFPLNADSEKVRGRRAFINEFKQKIQVGTGGNGTEKGLLYAQTFLKNKCNSATKIGWSRENSYLYIVFVSDEGDSSNQTVERWINRIKNNCPPKHFKAYAIHPSTASRYQKVAEKTGGLTMNITSMNNPTQFATTLKQRFSDHMIEEMTTTFNLQGTPNLTTLKVTMNNAPHPENCWTYHASSNSVKLLRYPNTCVPNTAAKLIIEYQRTNN